MGQCSAAIRVKKLCDKRNIKIVEDASESLGTFYSDGASFQVNILVQ